LEIAFLCVFCAFLRRIFFKIKEGGNYNHRNTVQYFEDYKFRLTKRLGKTAILRQPPMFSQNLKQAAPKNIPLKTTFHFNHQFDLIGFIW